MTEAASIPYKTTFAKKLVAPHAETLKYFSGSNTDTLVIYGFCGR
jgi:hypothetical protein